MTQKQARKEINIAPNRLTFAKKKKKCFLMILLVTWIHFISVLEYLLGIYILNYFKRLLMAKVVENKVFKVENIPKSYQD